MVVLFSRSFLRSLAVVDILPVSVLLPVSRSLSFKYLAMDAGLSGSSLNSVSSAIFSYDSSTFFDTYLLAILMLRADVGIPRISIR